MTDTPGRPGPRSRLALAETLVDADLDLEPLDTTAVAQFHRHHRAVFGTEPDRACWRGWAST